MPIDCGVPQGFVLNPLHDHNDHVNNIVIKLIRANLLSLRIKNYVSMKTLKILTLRYLTLT